MVHLVYYLGWYTNSIQMSLKNFAIYEFFCWKCPKVLQTEGWGQSKRISDRYEKTAIREKTAVIFVFHPNQRGSMKKVVLD